ncbi:hypothetical protein FBEOM_5889 [Fusarium beomiforme]|uniref:Uncharacterized protein n=1 Tax=Fusarium beomiforme TaxID=44412 RepID=A0A9P5ALS7_9HYPO|nr:hypothetical protein FBEOM_5889 [Fusarium beomiforme]
MDPVWDNITRWAADTSEEKRLAFAHIQVSSDSAQETEVPLYIMESPDILNGDRTILVQVLPDLKKNAVVKSYSEPKHPLFFRPGQPRQKLKVNSYLEEINHLKRQYQGKQLGFKFYPYGDYAHIIFIIDADPDYSAEFSLVLAAITTFSSSVATPARDLRVKVATMSSECIHEVTKELFKRHSKNFCEFRPSQLELEPENHTSERRMKIRNEQAVGFMAALDIFMDWPPGTQTLLNIVQEKEVSPIFQDGRSLLISHGYLNEDKKTPFIRLPDRYFSSPVCHALLPVVEFDWRIAYFLTLERTPLITLIKAHLAPVLTALSEVFQVKTSDLKAIQPFLKLFQLNGGPYAWSSRSTLWAGLGLSRMVHGRTSSEATLPVADGGISVFPEFDAFHSHSVNCILKILDNEDVKVAKVVADEQVDEKIYNEISRDLLRAYVHQIAFAIPQDFHPGKLPTLYNFYTNEPFEPNLNLAVVD